MDNQKISNLGQAVSVLIQAAEMAQSKGVYTLKDSALIFEAINFINELNEPKKTEDLVGPESHAPTG